MNEADFDDARNLLAESFVWDMHACMPLRPGDGEFLGQLDRAHRSGVNTICLNIGFGPQPLEHHLQMLAWFRHWVTQRPERYVLAHGIADIERARREGKLAVLFDIEGMGPLDGGDAGLVELFRAMGVAWMLVAYNRNNAAGGGCMDDDAGLSRHGHAILAEMKRVGMIVCCSHTGHRTVLEVMEAADNPVIFSHSNASAIHSHARNIPDHLITACAATGGVVGINGLGDFLGPGDDLAELVVRHVDHVVGLVGPDHVGLGLDFVFDLKELEDYIANMKGTFGQNDGVGFTNRFAPPETFIPVTARLLRLGYPPDDVRKIVGGNWYRVARQVWKA